MARDVRLHAGVPALNRVQSGHLKRHEQLHDQLQALRADVQELRRRQVDDGRDLQHQGDDLKHQRQGLMVTAHVNFARL